MMQDMEERIEKLFTVEEANSLIPKLRPLIKRVVASRRSLTGLQDEIQKARSKARDSGGSPCGPEYVRLFLDFTGAINEIEEMGVLVKDFQIGLCDFPHLQNGRVIYLCWKMDEEKVSYWHEIEAGFAGRQPLE